MISGEFTYQYLNGRIVIVLAGDMVKTKNSPCDLKFLIKFCLSVNMVSQPPRWSGQSRRG